MKRTMTVLLIYMLMIISILALGILDKLSCRVPPICFGAGYLTYEY